MPDDRLGEVPVAFVVAKTSRAGRAGRANVAGEAVDLDALRAWSRERLIPYKVPVSFTVVDSLPRNDMGKVLRDKLVSAAAEV